MKTDFRASLDNTSKLITTIIVGFDMWVFYRILVHIQNKTMHDSEGLIVVFLVLSLILVFSYLRHPKSYILSDYSLIINSISNPLELKFSDINSIKQLSKSDLSGTIRTFGVGGLFGYFGKFYNRKFGSMNWYVTQLNNRILIELKNGHKYIISPDDQKLTRKLQEKIC
jgi:hypothetical protein